MMAGKLPIVLPGGGQQLVYQQPDYRAVFAHVIGFHSVAVKVEVVRVGCSESRIQGNIPGLFSQPYHGFPQVGVFSMPPTTPNAEDFHGMAGRSPQLLRGLEVVSLVERFVGRLQEAPGVADMLLLPGFSILHFLILPYGAQTLKFSNSGEPW